MEFLPSQLIGEIFSFLFTAGSPFTGDNNCWESLEPLHPRHFYLEGDGPTEKLSAAGEGRLGQVNRGYVNQGN